MLPLSPPLRRPAGKHSFRNAYALVSVSLRPGLHPALAQQGRAVHLQKPVQPQDIIRLLLLSTTPARHGLGARRGYPRSRHSSPPQGPQPVGLYCEGGSRPSFSTSTSRGLSAPLNRTRRGARSVRRCATSGVSTTPHRPQSAPPIAQGSAFPSRPLRLHRSASFTYTWIQRIKPSKGRTQWLFPPLKATRGDHSAAPVGCAAKGA
jgi:hypothetical protein